MRILALVVAAAIATQTVACVAGAKPESVHDFKPEYEQLLAEYTNAAEAHATASRAATTREEHLQAYKTIYDPFLKRFSDFARRAEGTDEAAAALGEIFRIAWNEEDGRLERETADKLLTSYPKSPELAEVLSELPESHGNWAKDWLRKAIDGANDRPMKGAAILALGVLLHGSPGAADQAQGRALIESVAKEYGDTESGRRAREALFRADHLEIGKEAPDFEATDQDGRTFKLSDYRGKVVVIDFWGFW